MKKIILLILILLSTGCFEDSGKLVTTCVKKEDINTLYLESTYVINFKADIINNVDVTYYYSDRNSNTLSSIYFLFSASSSKFVQVYDAIFPSTKSSSRFS